MSKSILLLCTITACVLMPACSQADRTARVERRQDGIDSRFQGRQDRWAVRAEREDARCAARFDRW